MENTGFKLSSIFFILYIYRMKKIMKEKNQVVPDEILSKEFPCTDNLNGFTDTIRTVFSQSFTQLFITGD